MAAERQATTNEPTSEGSLPSQAGPDFAGRAIDEQDDALAELGLAAPAIGLALSGGGLRATLYHLGALWRMRELRVLQEVDAISGVSGGAIMAAILAKGWVELRDSDFSAEAFERLVVRPALRFSGLRIDAWVIGLGFLPFVRPAHVLAWVLRTSLLGTTRLSELPESPRFIFNAANVATGVSWVFQKAYMGDARLGVVVRPDVLLADAVAASASFPPVVAPFWLDLPRDGLKRLKSADLYDSATTTGLAERVLLLDGGAYDNLGVEPLEGACRTVLASSAGGNLKIDVRRYPYRFTWPLLKRTLDMSVEVGRAQRRRALIDRASAGFSGDGYRTRKVPSGGRPTTWVPTRHSGEPPARGYRCPTASKSPRAGPTTSRR